MNALIVITSQPEWSSTAQALIERSSFSMVVYTSLDGYGTRLVDDGPALILVDGALADWQQWTTIPKVSNATRRIPVVVVAQDAAVRDMAQDAGADVALAPDELPERLPDLLATLARVPAAETVRALDRQCGEPLPPEALEGLRLFNAGEYYQQHDAFEALWMQETGPVRDLYRAILQVGVAYYQIERGNRRGALKMLQRAVQWLDALPPACQGVDVAQLRQDAAQVREALAACDDLADFDHRLIQPVRFRHP